MALTRGNLTRGRGSTLHVAGALTRGLRGTFLSSRTRHRARRASNVKRRATHKLYENPEMGRLSVLTHLSLLSSSAGLRAVPFARAAVPIASYSVLRGGHGLDAFESSSRRHQLLRGGRALMSTATAEPTAPVEKFRKDYAPPPYRIDTLTLNFDIHEDEVKSSWISSPAL